MCLIVDPDHQPLQGSSLTKGYSWTPLNPASITFLLADYLEDDISLKIIKLRARKLRDEVLSASFDEGRWLIFFALSKNAASIHRMQQYQLPEGMNQNSQVQIHLNTEAWSAKKLQSFYMTIGEEFEIRWIDHIGNIEHRFYMRELITDVFFATTGVPWHPIHPGHNPNSPFTHFEMYPSDAEVISQIQAGPRINSCVQTPMEQAQVINPGMDVGIDFGMGLNMDFDMGLEPFGLMSFDMDPVGIDGNGMMDIGMNIVDMGAVDMGAVDMGAFRMEEFVTDVEGDTTDMESFEGDTADSDSDTVAGGDCDVDSEWEPEQDEDDSDEEY